MARSPTSRSLEYLRSLGLYCEVTEHWQSFGGRGGYRKDMLGWCDVLALGENRILGIQTTSGSNMSARVHKLEELPGCVAWLRAGGQCWILGWRKLKGKWAPRILVAELTNNKITFLEQA